jgi:type IV pilus assembly protein PilW
MCYSLEDKERGFTLVELLIGMLVGLIVLGALASTFIIQSRSLDVQEQVAEMVQTARAAMNMISHEVRMAGYDPASTGIVGIPYDASQLQILADLNNDGNTDGPYPDDKNEDVIYTYDDPNDRIDRDTGAGGQPFAENIQAFDFDYLKADGVTEVTSSADNNEIRQIKLTITARTSKPDPNYDLYSGYRRYTLISVITPPNLDMP